MMQNHLCDSLESRQRKAIMAQTYPGRTNKLLRGDGLVLWQHAQSGATHLLQHRLYPVLHQVVHPVHQQLQVHCSLKGRETMMHRMQRTKKKKTEGKLVEPHQGPVAAEPPGVSHYLTWRVQHQLTQSLVDAVEVFVDIERRPVEGDQARLDGVVHLHIRQ